MQFQWIDRNQFIGRCTSRAIDSYFKTQEHLKEIAVSPEKFDLDLEGIIDHYIGLYARNPEWMGKVSLKKVKIDIINDIYEYARMKKIEHLKNWAAKNWKELKGR